jgi:hypothetical protein
VTQSIPLEDIGTTHEMARRDRWGRYLIVPPGGGTPQGYTRVTTIAKALDSGGGLAPWKAAMTAQGLLLRKGLRAQWEALMASYGGDPWYGGEKGKAECKRLVEECSAVGGANDRKEQGSALHTITALVDVGRSPTNLTAETQRDIRTYQQGLVEAGVVVIPDLVETTVVLDSWQVAGTFDRLVRVRGFELPLIADLKTGASLEYSWQDIAVQLAAYSRGEAVYLQGAADDGHQDVRQPMPQVDQNWGLCFWLPAGKGTIQLTAVDLNAGWDAFELSMRARRWRANRGLTMDLAELLVDAKEEPEPVKGSGDDLTPILEASVQHALHQRRLWLQKRIDSCGEDPVARVRLSERWPVGVPTLKRFTGHTPDQLAAIETLLDDVERTTGMPFSDPRPPEPDPERVLRLLNPPSKEQP